MITYLIEVSICWVLFYSIYLLLLRKETFFNINRWYLLSTLVLGLLIPLFTVEFAAIFYEEPTHSVVYLAEGFSELEYVIEASVEEAKGIEYSWLTFVTLIYILGVIAAFVRFLYGFRQIYGLYKAGTIIKKGNYHLVITQTPHLPFSFFNYLFWNEGMALEDKDSGKIITHELAHINQWHSLDVLFLEFLGIALWFSPPIYWYTNNFIHSQLKQRINMMTRNKSRRKALTRYLPALPLLLLMVLVFSNKNVQKNFNETTAKASSAFEELSPEVLKALVATEDVSFFDFDANKAKEQMRIAYRDGSKGVFTESGAAVDWDAQKMKELDRVSKRLIAKYPEKEATIINLTMEVAAENGYSLHYVGESMRYREIKNFKKGEKIVMEIAKENLPSSKVLTETPPLFPEGEKGMVQFIYTNIKYPVEARSKGIIGTVDAQFDVEKDGSLSNLKINNDLGGGLNEEVLRVLRLMKTIPTKWTPATKDGVPVKATYKLPFVYHLEGEKEDGTTFKKDALGVKKGMHVTIVGYYNSTKNKDLKKAEQIYKVVDEMPRFPGCEDKEETKEAINTCAQQEMLQFIYSNIKYPAAARKAGIEGTVVARFVVDKKGQINKIEIVRNIGGDTDREVLSTIEKMPTWIPGKKDGKVVSVVYNLPVKFKLAEDTKPIEKEVDGIDMPKNPIMKYKSPKGEPVYRMVDKMPRFPGCGATTTYSTELKDCGDRKMLQFIYSNIKYPETARKEGIEGTVVIRFLIEKDGTIDDASILRNIGGGTGEEALRVVRLMKEQNIKWIPGIKDDKPVNFNFNLPIKFKLAEETPKSDKKVIYHPSAPKIPIGYEGETTTLDLGNKTITMNVFPNPVREQMSLTLEGAAKNVLLTVFDLSGKEYISEKIQSFGGVLHKTIDLSNAPKGTLIVNIRHKGKDYQKKVIVQ